MKFTFRTRVWGHGAALSDYARLFSGLEWSLFARVSAGSSPASLKREYLREHRIPARVFNSLRVSLEGRMASARESQRLHGDTLRDRISRAGKGLTDVERRGDRFQAHQKRRRRANLESRLARVEADMAVGRVRLCFGSKKLWRKRQRLAENGYGSHEEWLRDWREARSSEFFVLGSRDETGGCQLCVATVADDGSLTLRLRLPDCLAERWDKHLVIEGVRFAYGHDRVLAALGSNAEYAQFRRQHGEKAARSASLGQAISYRFKRDGRGWQVFATVDAAPAPVVTDGRRGVVGVDLNADHLAVCETDSSGNYTSAFSVPLVTYGRSNHQAEAVIGDAVARVVGYAREVGKPIVIERLDFRRKRAALEGESRKYSRMLCGFQLRQDQGLLPLPGLPGGSGGTSGQPGLQFGDRPGEVHGAIRAQRPPGSGLGAGPSPARLFRAHPPPAGLSHRQRRSRRLLRTREEAGEARVDLLGCGLGAAETGACSATPAGEAATRTQSGPDCSCG